jgi:hypothetical protein
MTVRKPIKGKADVDPFSINSASGHHENERGLIRGRQVST